MWLRAAETCWEYKWSGVTWSVSAHRAVSGTPPTNFQSSSCCFLFLCSCGWELAPPNILHLTTRVRFNPIQPNSYRLYSYHANAWESVSQESWACAGPCNSSDKQEHVAECWDRKPSGHRKRTLGGRQINQLVWLLMLYMNLVSTWCFTLSP